MSQFRPLLNKQAVSEPRRRFLEFLQRLHFGRIEQLEIRDGDPHFGAQTRVHKELKFPGENGPHPESVKTDFILKSQVVELLRAFDAIGDGTVELLEVKHGLPFRALVPETTAP